jgi:type IV pilus assembly protein PilZ
MTNDVPEIKCSFPNEDTLFLAYMPFIKGGALFIRTKQDYVLGSPVHLVVRLMDEQTDYSVDGLVVWISPKGAQGNKPSGIGIQFANEKDRTLINKIETYLAGMLKSTQMTDTI